MLNKIMLIGRLGKDPDFRTTPTGMAVARFSLATDEKRRSDSGELTSKTEWHRIVFFRRQAEVARDFLRKGSLIYLEGKIHYDSYDNKEGQKVYTTEILGDNFQMLDSRSDRGEGGRSYEPAESGSSGGSIESNVRKHVDDEIAADDDLPF
ncbi:MAG: single-stranded DNA-binding protein [Candidatus Delongbacteria bacterium]